MFFLSPSPLPNQTQYRVATGILYRDIVMAITLTQPDIYTVVSASNIDAPYYLRVSICFIVKVLDRNQFTPGRPLGTGTLWVGEQIPALYVFADITPQLERGYWPSYNVVSIVDCDNDSFVRSSTLFNLHSVSTMAYLLLKPGCSADLAPHPHQKHEHPCIVQS